MAVKPILHRQTDRVVRMARRGMPMGSDLRSLLRAPVVQTLLVATAAFQAVALTTAPPADLADADAPSVKDAVAAVLPAVPVVGAPRELAKASPSEARALEIAASYRSRGYGVTDKLARQIFAAAVDHDVDLEIAFGLIRAESSFRNQATSPVGAVGLMQLMPATARWLQPGVTRAQLRDPDVNLRLGFRYLRDLTKKYEGNVDLALLAYNRGPGTVDRAIRAGRNPDNGYARFVKGEANHGHTLYTRRGR
jgi:soluble lytic murein transglycosylase-like protein